MWSWNLVLWGTGFLGETHGWVAVRVAEAWGTVVSIAGYLVAVGLGVQILVAVLYIAAGGWFAFHAEPPARAWYDRVVIAALWLPFLAFGLAAGLVMMAYTVGAAVALYTGLIGLVFFLYEATFRGVLSLF